MFLFWTILICACVMSTLVVIAACIVAAQADRSINERLSIEYELEQLRKLQRLEMQKQHRDAEIVPAFAAR